MTYCRTCVIPDTRPGIRFAETGICSACAAHAEKKGGRIDWVARKRDLDRIIEDTKRRAARYDCIVPVSGGKDSTWQVVKCLEYGLRVLAVTWKTPGRTPVGQRNLDNLIRLGVDHIDYTIDPAIEARFMYKSLTRVGDTAVPMHMALFAIPLRLAVTYGIPLVMWGESPSMEYSGTEEDQAVNRLDSRWLRMHGILHGTSIDDWVDDDLPRTRMEVYRIPSDEEFHAKQIRSIFLGFYVPWDPEGSLRVALEHGFEVRAEGPKVGYYNYADIDCDFVSVHHYFKWLKFGFTRLFDNLALEIRNGRLSRDQAVGIIQAIGDQTPHEDIEKLCGFLDISRAHFWDIAERFRNPAIWARRNGHWAIDDFIVPDWKWS